MRPTSCLEKKSLQGDKRNEDFILEGFSASKEPEYKSVKRLETHVGGFAFLTVAAAMLVS